MNELISSFIELFRQYNMPFLAVVLLIQAIGVPLSTGVMVMAAGAFSYIGEYNFFSLFAEIWFFAAITDGVGYWFWRLFGKLIFQRLPRLDKYFNPRLLRVRTLLDSWGSYIVILSRFPLSNLGSLTNATAGITKFSFLSFISMAFVGEFFWVAVYLGLGYWFGDAWYTAYSLLTELGLWLILLILLAVVLYAVKRLLRKK